MGVGGLTLPVWKEPRPAWFPEEFDWVVGCTYRGMPESREPVRNLLGGNASFRREAFERSGGFQNGIGRSAGKRPLGCEETELCIRVSQQLPGSRVPLRRPGHDLAPGPRRIAAGSPTSALAVMPKASPRRWSPPTSVPETASRRSGRYATRTLPSGIAHGVGRPHAGDGPGSAGAGAITAGLGLHRGRVRRGLGAERQATQPGPAGGRRPVATGHRRQQ